MLHLTRSTALYARRAAASMYAPPTLREQPDLVEAVVSRLTRRRLRDLAHTLAAVVLEPQGLFHRLSQLHAPVAVLAGTDDDVLPDSTRTALTTALPRATITVTRGRHVSRTRTQQPRLPPSVTSSRAPRTDHVGVAPHDQPPHEGRRRPRPMRPAPTQPPRDCGRSSSRCCPRTTDGQPQLTPCSRWTGLPTTATSTGLSASTRGFSTSRDPQVPAEQRLSGCS